MAGIALPQRWKRQPTYSVGIDHSNPITIGLLGQWNPAFSGYESLGSNAVPKGLAGLTIKQTGVGFTNNSTDNRTDYWRVERGPFNYTSIPFGFEVLCKFNSFSSTAPYLSGLISQYQFVGGSDAAGPVFRLGNGNSLNASRPSFLLIYNSGTAAVAVDCPFDLQLNTVYHIFGLFDGANLNLYINGILAATTSFGAFPGSYSNDTNNFVSIGCDYADAAANDFRSLDGEIYLARIWGRAPNAAEVASLANNPWQTFRNNVTKSFTLKTLTNYNVQTSIGFYTLTGQSSNLLESHNLSVSFGNFTLTGQTSTLVGPDRNHTSILTSKFLSTTFPQSNKRVNIANPITKGLQFVLIPTQLNPADLLSGVQFTAQGGTTLSNNLGGIGWDVITTGTDGLQAGVVRSSLPTSVGLVFFPGTLASNANLFNFANSASLSAINRLGLRVGSANNLSVYSSGPTGTTVESLSPNTIDVTKINVAVGVFTGAASRTAYLNGQAGTVNTTSNIPTGTNTTNLGSSAATIRQNGQIGHYVLAVTWNRALTQAEAISFTKNPWQIFAGITKQVSYKTPISSSIYTLLTNNGAYSLTGQTSNLLRALRLQNSAGSYTLAGQNAGLLRALRAVAVAGSFALTGQTVTLTWIHRIFAALGSFVLTGQNAILLLARRIINVAGSFSLNGQFSNLVRNRIISADTGFYNFTPNTVNLLANKQVSTASGAYSLSGQSVGMSHSFVLTALNATYSLTGKTANLLFNHKIDLGQGSYTFIGEDVQLTRISVKTLLADSGLFVLNGKLVNWIYNRHIMTVTGLYNLLGEAVTLLVSHKINVNQGLYTLDGQNSNHIYLRGILADKGAYFYSGFANNLLHNHKLNFGYGQYQLIGENVTLMYHGAFIISPDRTFTVLPEYRTLSVITESRNYAVISENRMLTIEGENRDLGTYRDRF